MYCFDVVMTFFFWHQVMKIQSVKSEIRYTPNMILVKLVGSHEISQVILRISDIKKTKMVSLGVMERRERERERERDRERERVRE